MKKNIILCVITICTSFYVFGNEYNPSLQGENTIVRSFKRIYLSEFPGSYNPSLMQLNENFILTFRCQPNRTYLPWISYIGIALLDKSFNVIGRPQLLNTRAFDDSTPSQSEDARIFTFEDRIYIVFNDNMNIENPSYLERRDMYLAEIFIENDLFYICNPVCLIHTEKYSNTFWQKNWSPFEWQGNLLLSYTINPHEILSLNLTKGTCKNIFSTEKSIPWKYGTLRGSTPAQLVDGEYLAFFHSGTILSSTCSDRMELWHYFMGAYTFSADPPFELTSISQDPIDTKGFYTYSYYLKRVIYPGGFVIEDDRLYLALGKDDNEVWIATLDLNDLKKSMIPLHK